jgi:hypothetical protein
MTQTRVVMAVVVFLGVFALGGLGGVVWLISVGAETGSVAVVAGLTGTALGSMATMLASTRSGVTTPQDVQVVNKPADPVPVDAG